MKVVYALTRSDTVGGAAVHVRDCARAMLDRGDEAAVLVGGEGPFLDELDDAGIPHRPIPHLVGRPFALHAWVPAVRELRAALSELEPDLVSCHTSNAGFLGRLAAASLGVPALFTAHSWAFTEGKSRWRRAVFTAGERAVAPLTARLITVSDYDRRLALDRGVGRPDRMVTVHNGVPDVEVRLRADPRGGKALSGEPAGTGEEPCRIVMVARFERQKDHATLLRALARLEGRPWLLGLVGDGPRTADARRLARDLGIDGRVRFLGYRDDVAEVLSDTHLFALASRWEGFPRSILEAMRAGLPVVASDVGGVDEAVVEGETGYLVEPEAPGPMAGRLAAMIGDPARRERMGLAGRSRYEDRFTFDRMFERTRAIYEEVVEE